jgi:hypothetical protein
VESRRDVFSCVKSVLISWTGGRSVSRDTRTSWLARLLSGTRCTFLLISFSHLNMLL